MVIPVPQAAARVLVVDSVPEARAHVARLVATSDGLQLAGTAGTARDAIASAEGLAPDIVLMDTLLLDASGVEVIHDVRSRVPGVRVVVMSLIGDAANMRRATMAGAVDYLVKPFSQEELASSLLNAIARPVAPMGGHDAGATRAAMNQEDGDFLAALPPYLGLGILDPSSIRSSATDGQSASFRWEGEDIATVRRQPSGTWWIDGRLGVAMGPSFRRAAELLMGSVAAGLGHEDDWFTDEVLRRCGAILLVTPQPGTSQGFFPAGAMCTVAVIAQPNHATPSPPVSPSTGLASTFNPLGTRQGATLTRRPPTGPARQFRVDLLEAHVPAIDAAHVVGHLRSHGYGLTFPTFVVLGSPPAYGAGFTIPVLTASGELARNAGEYILESGPSPVQR